MQQTKHVSSKFNICSSYFEKPSQDFVIVLNPLLTDLPKLSEPEGFQIIEPFICDRLVFIYEDTATKRGFQ